MCVYRHMSYSKSLFTNLIWNFQVYSIMLWRIYSVDQEFFKFNLVWQQSISEFLVPFIFYWYLGNSLFLYTCLKCLIAKDHTSSLRKTFGVIWNSISPGLPASNSCWNCAIWPVAVTSLNVSNVSSSVSWLL